jgi:hypothetical protein
MAGRFVTMPKEQYMRLRSQGMSLSMEEQQRAWTLYCFEGEGKISHMRLLDVVCECGWVEREAGVTMTNAGAMYCPRCERRYWDRARYEAAYVIYETTRDVGKYLRALYGS